MKSYIARRIAKCAAVAGTFVFGAPAVTLAVLLLAGCASAAPPGSDWRYDDSGLDLAGYRGVVVVTFAPIDATEARCRELGATGRPEACTQMRHGICNIYAPPPLDAYDTRFFAVFRHELLHCAYGDWHDDW